MAKRISIINFKGGVGKTSLALHLATGLARYHKKRVLLVDVDHQSSLSLICLDPKKWEELDKAGKTIDAIFQHFTARDVSLPGKEIIYKTPYGTDYPNLDLIPATLKLDETELDLTSTWVGDPVESEWFKRALICRWIEKNNIDKEYDYIIFDCPPATKIVTQNAIAASHGYVIPVIPDSVSTRGLPHLINRMFAKIDKKFSGLADFLEGKGKKIERTYVTETKLIGIVISKIVVAGAAYSGYVNEHTRNLENIERLFPKYIIKPYIEEGTGVSSSLSRGYPVFDSTYDPNVSGRRFHTTFREIINELKGRIDKL